MNSTVASGTGSFSNKTMPSTRMRPLFEQPVTTDAVMKAKKRQLAFADLILRFLRFLFTRRNRLSVVSATQKLVGLVIDILHDEMDRAVDEGEIRSSRMARPEAPGHAVVGHGMLRAS